MAGRPRIFKEDEALEKSVELFWTRGYSGTSTEDLLASMHLNKGSLYHAFGNKKELFIRTMNFFAMQSLQVLKERIDSARNPIQGIRDFFLGLADDGPAIRGKGCFMGNTVAELACVDEELKEKAAAHLAAMENLFLRYIRQAKKEGVLQTKADAATLARYLLNVWNGINITRRIYPDKEMLAPMIRLQLSVLK